MARGMVWGMARGMVWGMVWSMTWGREHTRGMDVSSGVKACTCRRHVAGVRKGRRQGSGQAPWDPYGRGGRGLVLDHSAQIAGLGQVVALGVLTAQGPQGWGGSLMPHQAQCHARLGSYGHLLTQEHTVHISTHDMAMHNVQPKPEPEPEPDLEPNPQS